MHILYVVERFPSKTEYFILNEVNELLRRGFNVRIVARSREMSIVKKSAHMTRVLYPGNHIHIFLSLAYTMLHYRVPFMDLLTGIFKKEKRLITRLSEIRKVVLAAGFLYQIRNDMPNHIHAHFLFWPSRIGIYISHLCNIPLSLSAHARDIYCNSKETIRYLFDRAKLVFTCTCYNKRYLCELDNAAASKIRHIYHGVDLGQWHLREHRVIQEGRSIEILSVGRLVEKKGFLDLLRAIRMLNATQERFHCTIIGDGPQRSTLEDYISANNLKERVHLIGYVEQDLLEEHYCRSDVFVLPCVEGQDGDVDGLPNVILEALAVGVPVVSTWMSAIPEVIQHRQTGILVPPHSPVAICNGINEVVGDESLRINLRLNGRAVIERNFAIGANVEMMVEQLMSIYAAN